MGALVHITGKIKEEMSIGCEEPKSNFNSSPF